ncbi:MAG: hypothetical protein AB1449_12325 [Chloroflexota bacterium]
MRAQGQSDEDVNTLGMFQAVGLRQADGTPKPALAVWDGFRQGNPWRRPPLFLARLAMRSRRGTAPSRPWAVWLEASPGDT